MLDGFHIGVSRTIRIETAKDIGAAKPIILATQRFGVQHAIEDEVVKAVYLAPG